jgi:hypothetical protein
MHGGSNQTSLANGLNRVARDVTAGEKGRKLADGLHVAVGNLG